MWTCGNCQEVMEDPFDACWNCGCSREGKLALDFLKEDAAASRDRAENEPIADGFVCPRCGHGEARCRRLRMRGIGLQAIVAEDSWPCPAPSAGSPSSTASASASNDPG